MAIKPGRGREGHGANGFCKLPKILNLFLDITQRRNKNFQKPAVTYWMQNDQDVAVPWYVWHHSLQACSAGTNPTICQISVGRKQTAHQILHYCYIKSTLYLHHSAYIYILCISLQKAIRVERAEKYKNNKANEKRGVCVCLLWLCYDVCGLT